MRFSPTTSQYALPDLDLELLGAVDTVTGAMTLVGAKGHTLLVDCGMATGNGPHRPVFPAAALRVDSVVLTHGHLDHVGALPDLIEAGFSGPIFGTPTTLSMLAIVLQDALRLSGRHEDDASRLLRRLQELSRPIRYDTNFVPEGVRGRFPGTLAVREAGHILGSASVEITTEKSRVICSGDLGRPNSPVLRDYHEAWASDRSVDLVLMECTYGDREHAHGHEDVERELEIIIERALRDGGHILVPAFAIGRTQTLLYHLNSLVEAQRIPPLVVAVDTPMGLKVTELYQRSRHLFDREALDRLSRGDDPLEFEGLFAVYKGRDSARLREVKEPLLIIAGSGMCTGGRIVDHLRELLPRKETCVLFVGYQALGTPGAALQRIGVERARGQEHEQSLLLSGERVPVRAAIETLSGLSAHADRRELLRWLRAFPSVKTVALHHGEAHTQRAFAEWAERQMAMVD